MIMKVIGAINHHYTGEVATVNNIKVLTRSEIVALEDRNDRV
jgi:hypothetical protein